MECSSCYIKSLLSALWLVNDSAAVSLRHVLTRDRMTTFLCFSVSSFCCSSCCLPCHLFVDTCALMEIRTSQATDRSNVMIPCSSHSCLTDPKLLENPRKWCPVFHSFLILRWAPGPFLAAERAQFDKKMLFLLGALCILGRLIG